MSNFTQKISRSMISCAIILGLSACSGDDGATGPAGPSGPMGTPGSDGVDGNSGNPGFAAARFYLSNNGSDNAGTVDSIDQNAAKLKRVMPGNNEGLDLDPIGNLVQAGDAANGSIRTFCNVAGRANGAMFDNGIDRDLTGAATGLNNPKGIHFAQASGLIMVADFTGSRISIFGSAAAGDVAPVAEVVTSAAPWDLDYDEVNDRLYVALTNGDVAVYDDFVGGGFSNLANRTITPSDSGMAAISVNIHGIVYVRDTDTLILSDVGDAASATDGALFVINNASVSDGNVSVARNISGPSTLLGNPVDIVLTGSDLRVAEKSNDAILVFSNIFGGESGDVTPDLVTETLKPESLVEQMTMSLQADISDITESSTLLGVAVSSNPGTSGDTTGEVGRFSSALNSKLTGFDNGRSIESVTFDLAGDSYTTFDDPATSMGGIIVGNRVATGRSGEAYTSSRDRMITGQNTGLISPKGLDVNSEKGLIFVAENNPNTPSISIFSACASGDVAPLMNLIADNNARPWDVDYDASTDRAFMALTNGSIAVFDEVTARMRSGINEIVGEDRLILPAMGGSPVAAPTNIHGIDYDVASDSLIVSDVGSAASAVDGKIYVLPGAGSANGTTNMTVNISGPATNLGNPVDVMFDGKHLYVAEKSNSLIMRFDNIINSVGGNVAADISTSYTSPESVAVLPNYLYRPE